MNILSRYPRNMFHLFKTFRISRTLLQGRLMWIMVSIGLSIGALGTSCRRISSPVPERSSQDIERLEREVSGAVDKKELRSEAIARQSLGIAYFSISRVSDAASEYERAFALFRNLGDRRGQTTSLDNLGRLQWQTGQLHEALGSLNAALSIATNLQDPGLEANMLTDRGKIYTNMGKIDLALEDLNHALRLHQNMENSAGDAEVLTAIGQAYIASGHAPTALPFLEKAESGMKTSDNNFEMAETLYALGDAYNAIDPKIALKDLERSLPIARSVGNRRQEAAILNSTGEAYWALDDAKSAFDLFNRALLIRREIKDRDGEAVTLVDLGEYYSSSSPDKTFELDEAALTIFRSIGDDGNAAAALNNIGAEYATLGQPQKALEHYKEALSLEREVHNIENEAKTLHAIGATYSDLSQSIEAKQFYDNALVIERAIPDIHAEAVTLNNLAKVDHDLGQNAAALRRLRLALMLELKSSSNRDEALTLNNIGAIYGERGNSREAISYYNRALPMERNGDDYDDEALTLWHLAMLQKGAPMSGYLEALAVAQGAKDLDLQGRIETSLMDKLHLERHDGLAIYFGEKAVNAYQQIRGGMGESFDEQSRFIFVQSKSTTYRTLAELLASQNRLGEAVHVLNLLKRAELRESIRGAPAEKDSDTDPLPLNGTDSAADAAIASGTLTATTLVNITFERDRLDALARSNSLKTDERDRLDALNQQITEANIEIQGFFAKALFAELGNDAESNARIQYADATTLNLMTALAKLGPGTIALYTILGRQHSYIIVITSSTRKRYEINANPTDLGRLVLDFKAKADKNSGSLTVDLERLDHLLLDPIANDLVAAENLSADHVPTLLWSLDGLLRYVPMSALYDSKQGPGKKYLIERSRNVLITPFINHLLDPPSATPLRADGFGIFEKLDNLPALEKVEDELYAVVRDPTFPKSSNGAISGTIYPNEKFTIDALKASLHNPPPVVHIASHFIFQCHASSSNAVCGNESYLLLADGKHPGHGYDLTLTQIETEAGLNLEGTRLVTLAACGTAEVDNQSNGREIESLGMIAQKRNAAAVLATLWSVDDDSTAHLMSNFYRRWSAGRNIQKIEALRQAQLEMLRGYAGEPATYREPFYWAPFVLFGNFR
jgi:CHAT domain-containing protein/Tfp pilus assembly protein PilF